MLVGMYGEGDAENGGLSEHTRDEKDHIVMKIADYDVTIDWRNRVCLKIINLNDKIKSELKNEKFTCQKKL